MLLSFDFSSSISCMMASAPVKIADDGCAAASPACSCAAWGIGSDVGDMERTSVGCCKRRAQRQCDNEPGKQPLVG